MTKLFEIYNPTTRALLGPVEAESPPEALEAWCKAAGYGSVAAFEAALGRALNLVPVEFREIYTEADDREWMRTYGHLFRR